MFCPKCGSQERGNALFCRVRGERLGLAGAGNVKIICSNCRKQIDGAVPFCPHCGESTGQGVVQETSWAWWLLPVFFTAIGGLCGYFAVKDRNKKKATRLMISCFIMAAV